METLFKNNELFFVANPHISDFIHYFTLYSDKSFKFTDGDISIS